MAFRFKACLFAMVTAFVANTARAIVLPTAGSSYTEIDWAPLNGDGNSIATPLGVVSTSGAGGTYFVKGSSLLSGQGLVFGQDTLNVNSGFGTHQILFNYASGAVASELTVGGMANAILLPLGGASFLDLYSSTGITELSFSAIGHNIDNTFELGTLYVSDSGTALDGLGFDTPTLAPISPVPEPNSVALLTLGLAVLGLVRSSNRNRRIVSHTPPPPPFDPIPL